MTEAEQADESSSTRTPRSLIDRARSADPAAWAAFVDLYGPLVLRWCRRWHLQETDASDILQDVFLAVSTHLAKFRRHKVGDTFRGWLRVILRNKVNDHFRKLGREPGGEGGTEAQLRFSRLAELDVPEDASVAEDASESLLFRRCCERVRSEFHENTWRAFWRTAVEGRSANDVAAELKMSAVGVRVAKSRVLMRLREELGDLA
jgi:RNA polymerase sigma-70 factor, ECF subfamily